MILATDLDGTFLGGSEEGRKRLYDVLHSAPDANLIFVTGRGLARVIPLIEDPAIPTPDYVIADVGATVVHGDSLEPVEAIQQPIEERWPGADAVREALRRFDLREQSVPQERRLSYWLPGGQVPDELRQVVEEELGCDLLISAGQFLDVLPRGVNKGSTLLALLEETGLDHERVVVAGDTLNDLSLYHCELKGIVVGGAEEELRAQVQAIGGSSYLAEGPGCEGILEGLLHHGMLGNGDSGDATAHAQRATLTPSTERQLIMVYHRLPFDEIRRGDTIHRRPPRSPNGIIPTLLGFFAEGREGLWIGWAKNDTREPDEWEHTVTVDAEKYPNLEALRIPLTPEDVSRFYERFSKEALWPIIFSFPERASFNSDDWEHFLHINRIFAERTAEVAEPDAIVWVHDYNLWMVPHYLRELRPDVTIAFFHHTAFPPSDIFNILPWREQIVESLLQCDYVGFHIPRYVENFADVVRTHAPMEVLRRVPCTPRFLSFGCALGVDEVTTAMQVKGRTVRAGAHPVGINVKIIEEILDRRDVREMMDKLREQTSGRRSILSVERLDYVKGPLEKLNAFEILLEQHPELHGQMVLFTVCTPPAPGMKIYRSTREKLDQTVGRINGRFSRIDWTPVRYFYRSLPYSEVIAHYAIADVAWITPLRDGLNMVAKEYIAANHFTGGVGTLVLSEFAGAAAELHGALLTNPYDPQQMAIDLHQALSMPEGERRARMETMFDIVEANNIDYWSYEFLAAVEDRL